MNFSPIENQIFFRKKYKQKFLAILGCVIIFLLLINLLLISSYYLFLRIKSGDVSAQIKVLNNSNMFKKSSKAIEQLEKLDAKADFFEKRLKSGKNISLILEKILYLKRQYPVSIEFFSFNREVKGAIASKNIVVMKGKAETRTSFLNFIKDIEKERDLFEVRYNPNYLLKEKDFSYSLEIFVK